MNGNVGLCISQWKARKQLQTVDDCQYGVDNGIDRSIDIILAFIFKQCNEILIFGYFWGTVSSIVSQDGDCTTPREGIRP